MPKLEGQDPTAGSPLQDEFAIPPPGVDAPHRTLARDAANALWWKGLQLGGVKGIFLVRTLALAALLSPDDFGLLAMATVAVGVLMTVSELGMTPALVQQPHLEEAHYNAAWTVNVIRAAGVAAVLLAGAPVIAALFSDPRVTDILRVLALKPLIDASASPKTADLMRRLAYRRLAAISLSAAAVDTIVSLLLASRLGVWSLVAGVLAGALAGAVTSYAVAAHRPRVAIASDAVLPLVRYGRWLLLAGIVSVSASSLTQVVISRELGAVELGLYFLAAKLGLLPYEVLNKVVSDVAFAVYARLQAERARLVRAFQSILVATAAIGVPAYVLIISLAPWLVADVLGPRWEGTEGPIRVLALAGIAGLFGDVTEPLFRGLGRPKWVLAVELLQSSLTIVLLWPLTHRYGLIGAALAGLFGVSLSQLLSLLFATRVLGAPVRRSMVPISIIVLSALLGAATVPLVQRLASGTFGLVCATVIATTTMIAVLWGAESRFDVGLRRDLAYAFPQIAGLVGMRSAAP
ncbi:MAG TPA: lipopolysaccharide biosynthesis protein [Gemmatimonadales bacterium]|nr:lipopolysaccharide biosynthesis protein [Gemmatimonadales bacterium]